MWPSQCNFSVNLYRQKYATLLFKDHNQAGTELCQAQLKLISSLFS